VSIKQLRATSWQNSIRSQKNAVRDKLDGSLKTLVQTKSRHQQTLRY
jgi:hypothetical protein